jgi:Flp pilus assembly pilin Flp
VAEVVEDREPSRKGRVTGEEGQGLVEYGLILLLVAMALVGVVGNLGSQALAFYESFAVLMP